MPRLIRNARLLLLAAVTAGLLATPATASDEPEDETFEQATLDYMTWCGPCHGRTGKGDGPYAATLKTAPPDLTGLSARADGKFPADMVRERIDGRNLTPAHGTVEMPVWGYWFALHETAGGLLQSDRATAEKNVRNRIGRLVDYLHTIQE